MCNYGKYIIFYCNNSYYFESNGILKTGWVKSGGNWRYYKGNKAVVGWLKICSDEDVNIYYFTDTGVMISDRWYRIDGKWYYFNKDGTPDIRLMKTE